MVAGYEYKRYAGRLGQLCRGVEEVLVFAIRAVVAFVLVYVAQTEDDARLRHQVGCSGEADLLRAVVAHGEDVLHDGGEVAGRGAVVAVLVGVAVRDKDAAEPHVLGKEETVGTVLIGKDLQLVVADGGGGRVGCHLAGIDGHAVHLYGSDKAAQTGAGREGDSGEALSVALGHVAVVDAVECERHLCPRRCGDQGQQAEYGKNFLHRYIVAVRGSKEQMRAQPPCSWSCALRYV